MLCVFDVNETMLDMQALDETFLELTGDPAARHEWFTLVIHTALTITATGEYRDFAQIAGACVDVVVRNHGRQPEPEDRAAVGGMLRSLPPHPDVRNGLLELRDAGHELAVLANSPLTAAQSQIESAGLSDVFSDVFSAEQAGVLKPAAGAYEHVLRARGVAAPDAVMVAAHDWDIAGAIAAGMKTALITRPGVSPLPTAAPPTVSVSNFANLAEKFAAI